MLWTARSPQAMDRVRTLSLLRVLNSLLFFFSYGKTFDYHEIYVHGVMKKWSARRKPSILSSGA